MCGTRDDKNTAEGVFSWLAVRAQILVSLRFWLGRRLRSGFFQQTGSINLSAGTTQKLFEELAVKIEKLALWLLVVLCCHA